MKGNEIMVSPGVEPKGEITEGFIKTGETPQPGVIMQMDFVEARIGGRPCFKIYNRDADGDRPAGPHYVLLNRPEIGQLPTTAYAAGEVCRVYAPLPGDELNLYLQDTTGTSSVMPGQMLIVDDGTGEMIATTGSPEEEVAMLLEAVSDVGADQLAWCKWMG